MPSPVTTTSEWSYHDETRGHEHTIQTFDRGTREVPRVERVTTCSLGLTNEVVEDITYGTERWTHRCACGCGQRTRSWDANFMPGHDARLRGRLVRLGRRGDDQAITALGRWGWSSHLDPENNPVSRGLRRRSSDRRAARNYTPGQVHTVATRRFGVEIEFAGGITREQAAEAIRAAGIPARTEHYNHRVPTQWKVTTDATVSGGEVVSPPLSGDAGLEEVATVVRALVDAGATVNSSCGLHVHHEVNDLSRDQLANVVQSYYNHQDLFEQLISPSRRNNGWCARYSERTVSNIASNFRNYGGTGSPGRYYALNVECYPRQGTFEFRAHQGTLNPTKIVRWISLGQQFIQRVADNGTGDALPRISTVAEWVEFLNLEREACEWFVNRATHFGFNAGTLSPLEQAQAVVEEALPAAVEEVTDTASSGDPIILNDLDSDDQYRLIVASNGARTWMRIRDSRFVRTALVEERCGIAAVRNAEGLVAA